jgi:hypothetical protein
MVLRTRIVHTGSEKPIYSDNVRYRKNEHAR